MNQSDGATTEPTAPATRSGNPTRIFSLRPRSFSDAPVIGEHFRSGHLVIMNLSELEPGDAKRMVDFAAGLIMGLRGNLERISDLVFMVSPQHVEIITT